VSLAVAVRPLAPPAAFCTESPARPSATLALALPSALVSWVSPVARALLKAREGDEVRLTTPTGVDRILISEVRYEPIDE
jgi:hypothetical protein